MLSQLQVLRSRAVLGPTVDDLGLRLVPDNGFRVAALQDVRVAQEALPATIDLRFVREGVRARGDCRRGVGRLRRAAGAGRRPLHRAGAPGNGPRRAQVIERERAIERLAEDLRARPREETDVVDVEYTAATRCWRRRW
jgi:hypothetical protein